MIEILSIGLFSLFYHSIISSKQTILWEKKLNANSL